MLGTKNRVYLLPFIILGFMLLSLVSSQSRAQEKAKIQEEVTVTAVEVPVRVLHKGEIVKGLTKEDFEVYENGVKQKITVFEAVSRKIVAETASPQAIIKPSKKRFFILIFNIFDYSKAVGEAIDYFFKNFFHPGDKLIIVTEDKLFNIERGESLSEMISNLKETLKKYKLISTAETYKDYKDLKYEADRLRAILRGEIGPVGMRWDQAIINFYDNYQRVWTNYRRQYLFPDLGLYRSIIKRVKQFEGEKWAICFQQREMFPKLKNEGPLEFEIRNLLDSKIDPRDQVKVQIVLGKQMELQRIYNITNNFPTNALKNLFMETNITFHLILLKTFRTVLSQDFELKEVAQDYEDCFRQISASTGGSVTFSNKVTEALKKAAEVEDYYYLLVYSPKENQEAKERKIEVKVKRNGVDVISLKYVPEKAAPPIAITNFQSGRKTIRFTLANYKMAKIKGKTQGIAEVKIMLFDENSHKVFDEGRTLSLIKKETNISLNFNRLQSGYYFIIIQAVDRIANEIDVFSSTIKL